MRIVCHCFVHVVLCPRNCRCELGRQRGDECFAIAAGSFSVGEKERCKQTLFSSTESCDCVRQSGLPGTSRSPKPEDGGGVDAAAEPARDPLDYIDASIFHASWLLGPGIRTEEGSNGGALVEVIDALAFAQLCRKKERIVHMGVPLT